MGSLTLDIIGLSAFGYEFRALDNAQDDSLRAAYGTFVAWLMTQRHSGRIGLSTLSWFLLNGVAVGLVVNSRLVSRHERLDDSAVYRARAGGVDTRYRSAGSEGGR